MTITRECKACDGSGKIDHYGAAGSHTVKACLACGWSGQITDQIPASDAIADAETLRLWARDNPSYQLSLDVRLISAWLAPNMLVKNHIQVRADANAAFRAVPGLRG